MYSSCMVKGTLSKPRAYCDIEKYFPLELEDLFNIFKSKVNNEKDAFLLSFRISLPLLLYVIEFILFPKFMLGM